MSARVERRRRYDENRGVDEERKRERDGRVHERVAHGFTPTRSRLRVATRLHDRRMQIEIVRHHRRTENADRDVEHIAVANDFGSRNEARRYAGEIGLRAKHLEQKAQTDRGYQSDDERLEEPESLVLQEEHEHHVERGEHHAPRQWKTE